MDALLEGSQQRTASAYQTWDFATKGDIVPIITGDNADAQGAAVTAYTQRGTIPQLPEEGIPWVESLTGLATFGEVDNTIRQNLIANGHDDFQVDYSLVNEGITAKVSKKKAVSQ